MIEKTIRDYLVTRLTGTSIYVDVPASPGAKYVVVEKTGGGIEEHIRHSVVTVQSYAGSRYEAAILNDSVVMAMLSAVSLPEISAVELNSDYDYTDTTTKHYRYQAVFDVVHY